MVLNFKCKIKKTNSLCQSNILAFFSADIKRVVKMTIMMIKFYMT